jgi:hypothetical protein
MKPVWLAAVAISLTCVMVDESIHAVAATAAIGEPRPVGRSVRKENRRPAGWIVEQNDRRPERITGDMPLDVMLSIMRDENQSVALRIEMAKEAAPYCHPKLAAIEHGGEVDPWVWR